MEYGRLNSHLCSRYLPIEASARNIVFRNLILEPPLPPSRVPTARLNESGICCCWLGCIDQDLLARHLCRNCRVIARHFKIELSVSAQRRDNNERCTYSFYCYSRKSNNATNIPIQLVGRAKLINWQRGIY